MIAIFFDHVVELVGYHPGLIVEFMYKMTLEHAMLATFSQTVAQTKI